VTVMISPIVATQTAADLIMFAEHIGDMH
jgi:hypothetical protein